MVIDDQTIIRICGEVRRFSQIANWQWSGLPVIQWEFPTISAFARAKMQLLAALSPMMMMHMRNETERQRATSKDEFEIDCNGVTFRLMCKQRIATPLHTVWAAEMVFRQMPPKQGD